MAWESEWSEVPPLVLLHGMSSGGFAWSPAVPALQAAGRVVVVLDLPGHEHGQPIEDEDSFDSWLRQQFRTGRIAARRLTSGRLSLVAEVIIDFCASASGALAS